MFSNFTPAASPQMTLFFLYLKTILHTFNYTSHKALSVLIFRKDVEETDDVDFAGLLRCGTV
jgi:hypothetical protein